MDMLESQLDDALADLDAVILRGQHSQHQLTVNPSVAEPSHQQLPDNQPDDQQLPDNQPDDQQLPAASQQALSVDKMCTEIVSEEDMWRDLELETHELAKSPGCSPSNRPEPAPPLQPPLQPIADTQRSPVQQLQFEIKAASLEADALGQKARQQVADAQQHRTQGGGSR